MSRYFTYIKEHLKTNKKDTLLIRKLSPHAKNILDIGCGTGVFLEYLKGHGAELGVSAYGEGIDIDKDTVDYCRKRKLNVRFGNGIKTKYKNSSFDVVRAKEVLEHIDKPEKLIMEIRRILKKGGLLILHVPTHYSLFYPFTNFFDDYTHIRPFTKKGIILLLGSFGFTDISISGYTIGRNFIEDTVGIFLGKIFPFVWRVTARKNDTSDE